MAEAARPRRLAIRSLIAAALAAVALWRFFTPRRAVDDPSALAVPESDVPARGALVLPEERIAIVNDGASFYALDLTCTHLGCTVKGTPTGFACPCHGSRFDPTGRVLVGPAPRPLRRLALVRDAGMVRVSRGRG